MSVRIYAVQNNPFVGAPALNAQLAKKCWLEGKDKQADLVVFSEMFISGYPLEDLALYPAFVEACMEEVKALAALTTDGPAMLIGSPWASHTPLAYNAAILLRNGTVELSVYKYNLPNYKEFDEKRHFMLGRDDQTRTFMLNGITFGIGICEELWFPEVMACLKAQGAMVVLSPNGSPYAIGKMAKRQQVLTDRINETGLPIIYVNQVGGQDELVFDGRSMVMTPQQPGPIAVAAHGKPDSLLIELDNQANITLATAHHGNQPPCEYAEIIDMLILALRDYMSKGVDILGNYRPKFSRVNLGLSGGLDSAVVFVLALLACGKDNVRAFKLPYTLSSTDSIADADALLKTYSVTSKDSYELPIGESVDTLLKVYQHTTGNMVTGIAKQNLQARVRGLLLMLDSNVVDTLLLTTGNLSEVMVGYCTLYGDMNGGYNLLKDLPKDGVVRQLAHYLNTAEAQQRYGLPAQAIPNSIIDKTPSADLEPGQTDEASLGVTYRELERITDLLMGDLKSKQDIIRETGIEEDKVRQNIHRVFLAEYKRRQAAPGPQIGGRAWAGRVRRMPITHGWRG